MSIIKLYTYIQIESSWFYLFKYNPILCHTKKRSVQTEKNRRLQRCTIIINDTYVQVHINSHVLCDSGYALMALLWFHLNVLTSSQCCSYPHQQNRLACSGSSIEMEIQSILITLRLIYFNFHNTHFHRHALTDRKHRSNSFWL